MKGKRFIFIALAILVAAGMLAGLAVAEDGIMFRRNVSKTPEGETEKAGIFMMDFYVPAQAADGTVLTEPLEYLLVDGTVAADYDGRYFAKPLVSVYIDDIGPTLTSVAGGIVLGEFDAFVGYSLDDGDTWRTENLSRSADLSSFTLDDGEAYPGGVHAVVHQVAEDKILAAWASKYCDSGFPLYSLSTDANLTTYAGYLGDLEATYGKNAMYLYDLFGVAGNQKSVDYTELGWPEVGEVPYSCVWTARGKLLAGDDPMTDLIEASHIVWTTPERLTSGVRDANLPAVDCAKGAGCALTWQEDPEGLRPGQGLGPGEGWSGAIANAKTDIWYSYISFNDFDLVDTDGDFTTADAVLIEDLEATLGTAMIRPKPYVPMAMPVRLTDNDMCKGVNESDPYCWIDFDKIDEWNITNVATNLDNLAQSADSDFCETTYSWTNPGGTTLPICITENGRYMFGRVGATRVRMVLKPYFPDGEPTDLDLDGFPDDASAWLSFAAEETKALGTTDLDDTVDPVDIGKDMYYYSFDYAKPYNLHVNLTVDADINPALDEDDPYVVQQGGMLNQPAVCSPWFITYENMNPAIVCNEGDFFGVMVDEETTYEYYLTEIARRFALTLNNPANITNPDINESGLAGILIYKQGIIWQGGPADIMLRRLVVPDDFDVTTDNPYAFRNMVCEDPDTTGDTYSVDGWIYTDGSNPNYLEGLCMEPGINITGTTIKTCTTGTGNDACAAEFPVADDGTIYTDLANFPKVLEWRQCDALGSIADCEDDADIDDQTWENPYDVAKGHRGFLYGDMVMMMYAWSPNWQSNRVGNDHYNLYQRRSFDGGLTWTTPDAGACTKFANLSGIVSTAACDGTSYQEYYYGETIGTYVPYLWEYGPGEFEQARNLSLLHGNKVTILDPRYSPPGGLKQYANIGTNWLTANGISFTDLPYPDDAGIDPSKYFMVYETGDNTTVAVGEATPLDLFYSRATDFGDTYEFYDYINDAEDCNPVVGEEIDWTACVEPRWPWLENATEDLSGEASVVFNPGGTFAYNVWNQWKEEITDDGHELVFDSDMIFRRNLWLPDDSTVELAPIASLLYTGPVMYDWEMDITLIATARDIDKVGEGIVAYEWQVDGVIDEDETGNMYNAPARNLSNGWHGFSMRAKDAEGHWSNSVTVDVYVTDILHNVKLPLVLIER